MRGVKKLFNVHNNDWFTEVRNLTITGEIMTFVLNSARYNTNPNHLDLKNIIKIIAILCEMNGSIINMYLELVEDNRSLGNWYLKHVDIIHWILIFKKPKINNICTDSNTVPCSFKAY